MALASSSLLQAFAQRFAALDSALPGYAARQRAWLAWQQQGLPSPQSEAYKYTPIATTLSNTFSDCGQGAASTQLPTAAVEAALLPGLDAYTIVLLNGQLSKPHTPLASLPATLQVCTFEEVYQQQGDAWKPADLNGGDAFATLNAALFDQGLWIRLADHVVLDKPLVIYHLTDARTQQAMTFPRIRIVGGKNSQASIITVWGTMGAQAGLTNALTEVELEADARLDHYTLQLQPGLQAYYISQMQCQQELQSVLNTYAFTWGGALVRNNLHIAVNASHTETNMHGLYCLLDAQHVDNHTQVDHRQPHTCSHELYKGIVTDRATGVFNGCIYVQQAAQQTHAFQTNNNWVLSDDAKVHTKPQLEIWADDVKCSHGATIGQLDAQQLFYLRSRGLSEATARQLLLQAFASEVMDKVSLTPLRAYLQDQLSAKIQAM